MKARTEVLERLIASAYAWLATSRARGDWGSALPHAILELRKLRDAPRI